MFFDNIEIFFKNYLRILSNIKLNRSLINYKKIDFCPTNIHRDHSCWRLVDIKRVPTYMQADF